MPPIEKFREGRRGTSWTYPVGELLPAAAPETASSSMIVQRIGIDLRKIFTDTSKCDDGSKLLAAGFGSFANSCLGRIRLLAPINPLLTILRAFLGG